MLETIKDFYTTHKTKILVVASIIGAMWLFRKFTSKTGRY